MFKKQDVDLLTNLYAFGDMSTEGILNMFSFYAECLLWLNSFRKGDELSGKMTTILYTVKSIVLAEGTHLSFEVTIVILNVLIF